ncbi:signal transduction histidine kinase [Rhodobium orientis]|uniref:histidine kinase n=1 Tax=Rhodobium orientis TaxID=34017 RepID=A0A327JK24_9HYPH|nr:ATP-binding protein [Rhodobium orientis]MBB4305270.1 signal transduction histidine kinase [Rhodobium orientis]MBK5949607.1 two-component sensor histidine kinase [Rhodobium orientis]RAI25162.1 two-component sensor histidine kinase [Rhodobium orientis]
MFLPRELRSISFRVALIYTVFFLGSVLAILGTTYLAASSEMTGILRAAVADDMDELRQAFRSDGEAGLRHEMEELLERASQDRFFLFRKPDGSVISGNLPTDLWRDGWNESEIPADRVRPSADIEAAASQAPEREVRLISLGERIGPFEIMIARNLRALHETQETILSAMLWGGLVTTLLALAGGFLISVGPTRRVDRIAATMRRIVEGHLDLRLPVSGRRDELDRLAGDINMMLARIETLLASLRQVSTDIAHDLRTPLARLRQRLESVRRKERSLAEYEAAIDAAIGESDAAIETFNALLRVAQIEAGTRRSRFRRLALGEVVERVCDIYAEVATDTGHTMSWDSVAAATVDGDEELLTQLLANLIENAINHVPAPGRIAVSLHRDGDTAVLSVADDGPGVPEGEREKIFRRLYRLDRSRTTPGSGLGLSLVAAIVELHAGKVEALDNAPGLCVRITLPLAGETG